MQRDELFRSHPQSPIPAGGRHSFNGLDYFEPDASYRIRCKLESVSEGAPIEIDTGGEDGVIRYRRAGVVHFQLHGVQCRLTVLSLVGYGGGLFLPFRDATSGRETYGGGRYLFDTVKNTDGLALTVSAGSAEITIDFNYAYNPSCAYDARWACPLAPAENKLQVGVAAGEKVFSAE
ncbi:MAG TPA: DUF1684 domain-containing protein [Candidatus Dormibacteraeota bacterium]